MSEFGGLNKVHPAADDDDDDEEMGTVASSPVGASAPAKAKSNPLNFQLQPTEELVQQLMALTQATQAIANTLKVQMEQAQALQQQSGTCAVGGDRDCYFCWNAHPMSLCSRCRPRSFAFGPSKVLRAWPWLLITPHTHPSDSHSQYSDLIGRLRRGRVERCRNTRA